MEHILSIDELQVSSKKNLLLDIEHLRISAGMQIAIVGGNGAGKTTLIESLLGLRELSSGQVNWLDDASNIGVQLQQASYNTDLLVKEVVILHQNVYHKIDPALYTAFDLKDLSSKKYGVLSRGEKQRVDLYIAMAHNPRSLLLDEPGTGLDKKYYKAFIEKIETLKQREDFTLLMASHSPLEVKLSSHLLWVEKGRIKKFNTKQSLFDSLLGPIKIEISSENKNDIEQIKQQLIDDPCITRLINSSETSLTLFGLEDIKTKMFAIADNFLLKKFSISETCEDDFLSFIGGSH